MSFSDSTAASLTVTCTTVEPSTCSDHPGAVDADLVVVFDGDAHTASVTLLPDHNGHIDIWGSSRDYWASDDCQSTLDAWSDATDEDGDEYRDARELTDAIVGAVVGAVQAAA